MRILSYHQVPSCYLNFLTFLSSTTSAADLGFGGFRVESSLLKPKTKSDELGRSGRRIQLCYNLGTVEDNRPIIEGNIDTKDNTKAHLRWVRPHASIHHQFDPERGTMLWIITAPVTPQSESSPSQSKIWTDDFKRHIENNHNNERLLTPVSCFSMSLDIHLKLAAWSIGDFSYCMQDIDDRLRQLVCIHNLRSDLASDVNIISDKQIHFVTRNEDKRRRLTATIYPDGYNRGIP